MTAAVPHPQAALAKLALHGGDKVRKHPWPARRLFGEEEKQAAIRLFDQAIAQGEAFGYNGPEEQGYCQEFVQQLGGGFADAVNSGSNAVYIALRALELEPYSEVIVPPISDPGGFMPVPLCGCIPIPADAAPLSYNAGPQQIQERITKRTKAIMVAHIAGIPCDMDPILEIARAHGIPVLEDCAQAHGARYRGKPVGAMGTIAAFSTMFGKHHATAGQGGVVFTRNEELSWRARRYADRGKPFGLTNAGGNVVASLNMNNDELACAIGRVQLAKLPQCVADRRRFALAVGQGCQQLRSVRLIAEPAGSESSYWFLFFRLDLDKLSVDKSGFCAALAAEGLPVSDSYFCAMEHSPWYQQRAMFGKSQWPWSSPQYQGDSNQQYPLPNMTHTDRCTIKMGMHERFGEQEVRDTLAALAKVEAAYAR